MEGFKAFYREASTCEGRGSGLSESFDTEVGVTGIHNVTMINIVFMNSCMREIKAKVEYVIVLLKLSGVGWSVMAGMCG